MSVASRQLRHRRMCVSTSLLALVACVDAAAAPAVPAVTPPSKPTAPVHPAARPAPGGAYNDRIAKLIAEGKAALEARDFPKAQRSFEQAYWFRSSPDLLYLLGQVAEAQEQKVTALDLYRRYLDSGIQGQDEATAESLRKRVEDIPASTSEVSISGHGGGLLSVDGRLLGILPLSRALLLPPGPHRFKIESKGANFESDPLTIPEGRTAELHLTPGTAGSMIAVLTLNSLAVLTVSSPDVAPEKTKVAEESVVTAARNEHTVFLPVAKLQELTKDEPKNCLDDAVCLDRISAKSDIRYRIRVSLQAQPSSPNITTVLELFDVASGLRAEKMEESIPAESLGSAMVTLTRRVFQTALTRPRGTLKVESNPSDATVTIDERVLGSTPFERISLVGKHQIRVERSGFLPFAGEVRVAPGQIESVAVTLTERAKPPAPPAPEFVTIPGESHRSRTARWVLGGVTVGMGLSLIGLGGWALSQNGKCGDKPVPEGSVPCELVYSTAPISSLLIGTGAGLTIGGSLLMLLPGRRPRQVLAPTAAK